MEKVVTATNNNLLKTEEKLNSRMDDLKWFIGVFSASIAFLVAGLTIVVGFNLNSEKSSLREFKESMVSTIKEKLGEFDRKPKIELLNIEGGKLSGTCVEVRLEEDEDKDLKIWIPQRFHNIGNAWSGKLFGKYYTKGALKLRSKAALETGYDTEAFIASDSYDPKEIPPGVSIERTSYLYIKNDFMQGQEAEVKFVLSYGDSQTVEAVFMVKRPIS
jgi:hypothetical protein